MRVGKLTEKRFMAMVVQLARVTGWLVYHTYDSRRSAGGFPDLLFLRGSEMFVAELKSAAGKVTATQAEWLEAFRTAGVRAFLWRPADWEQIEAVLCGKEEM